MSEYRREAATDMTETPLARQLEQLDSAVERLTSPRVANLDYVPPVLEIALRLMRSPEGIESIYDRIPQVERAGIFAGTVWDTPLALLPGLVGETLTRSDQHTIALECINQLRFLAVAKGDMRHPGLSSEQAMHYLTQVLALNLSRLFDGGRSEAEREHAGATGEAVDALFQYLASHIGFENVLGSLIDEIWRILGQRPIQVNHVKNMVNQIAITLTRGSGDFGDMRLGADRLISALFGPTQGCIDDPGLAVYRERLGHMDTSGLQQEAHGFARAMHDTGLVSDYHAAFLRWLLDNEHTSLIDSALGLSNTGVDAVRCYPQLVHTLLREISHPHAAQAVYGLTMMLEKGVLYSPPIAPGLWRQINLELSPAGKQALSCRFGSDLPPHTHLLAGVLLVLGLPLGVGQGNNPTCQSARAISMWALNDPDYLLHLVAQVARFDNILMHFEGRPLSSAALPAGLMLSQSLDNDPVSTLLVPHLDRIYLEMGRLCEGRGEDPHRWVNPEFHGWWVGTSFAIAVDVATGMLQDYEGFVHRFYASYHPFYNGNQPIIHPQPAGLAVTDSNSFFVGWHAIALNRVAMDQSGVMRVYFYNPNNDSGQNWGDGVEVSTQGNGENFGEGSLPFYQLASRLYIFHDDPLLPSFSPEVPDEEVERVVAMGRSTWAADRHAGAGIS